MAKPKTKAVSFGLVATETAPGVWEWMIDDILWRWHMGSGVNLERVSWHGVMAPAIYCSDIKSAVQFSVGWESGFRYGKATTQDRPED